MSTATSTARATMLSDRLLKGARDLADLANTLTDAEWQKRGSKDARKMGVLVHHVASMYPIEIQLAQVMASGKAVEGVTWDAVHEINSKHAKDFDGITKAEALALLDANSKAASEAILAMSDEELDRVAPLSLNDDTPLTCQFMLEDHAVRHSYHHTKAIRAVVGR